MSTEEHVINHTSQGSTRLLSKNNIKTYLLSILGITIIIALLRVFLGAAIAIQPPDGQLPGGPPGQTLPDGPALTWLNSWPLWGQLVFPSLVEIAVSVAILVAFGLAVIHLYRETEFRPNIYAVVLIGALLIIATNLIHGWEIGVVQPIAGDLEIFADVLNIEDALDFISNYETLQPTLTTHARTQPPGAVLAVYLISLFLNTPGLVAIGLCFFAAVGSALFLRGIIRKLFDEDSAQYTTLLYLLLPAVQVYYLANIYALVATLSLGVLYFYLHPDRRVSTVGSFLSLFLLTFITFLSFFMVVFLVIYEVLGSRTQVEATSITDRLKATLRSLKRPFLLSLCVGATYGLLVVTLGFNYINAFLYASALENPNGFMLLANPIEYVTTRVQNILDIVIFFGPILSVLAYRGMVVLREEATQDTGASTKYNLVLSALVALGLLFLVGAPKKGETARICMFILPFLLIPVITYIQRTNMSRRDKVILLSLVFVQTVLLQLLGIWVW